MKKTLSEIELSREAKAAITQELKRYFREELDQEIGGFDAEFLLDFFSKTAGAYYYNRGLFDAQTLLRRKLDDVADTLDTLEKPTAVER